MARLGSIRHSNSTVFSAGETRAVDALGALLHSEAGLSPPLGFHYQVLSYAVGESYSPHHDCGDPATASSSERYMRGGTALYHRSDPTCNHFPADA
jgi:hypothetical protein